MNEKTYNLFVDLDEKLNDMLVPFLLRPLNGPLLTEKERKSIRQNYEEFLLMNKELLLFVEYSCTTADETNSKNLLSRIQKREQNTRAVYVGLEIANSSDVDAKKVNEAFLSYDVIVGKLVAESFVGQLDS